MALPPSRNAVAAMEDCNAKDTLQAEPAAAGAYDCIPLAAVSAVFTLDTSTDLFVMHSIQVEFLSIPPDRQRPCPIYVVLSLPWCRLSPLTAGSWSAAGACGSTRSQSTTRAPFALPCAAAACPLSLCCCATCQRWAARRCESIMRLLFLGRCGTDASFAQGVHLPPSLVLGDGTVRGTMEGSHSAPDIRAAWELPTADASGTADLSRDSAALTCRAPAIDLSGAVHLVPPDPDAVKRAVTQREASALATPVNLPFIFDLRRIWRMHSPETAKYMSRRVRR